MKSTKEKKIKLICAFIAYDDFRQISLIKQAIFMQKQGSVSSVYMRLAQIADESPANQRSPSYYKLDPQKKKHFDSDLEELNRSSMLNQSTLQTQLCDHYSKIKNHSHLSQSTLLDSHHFLPNNSDIHPSNPDSFYLGKNSKWHYSKGTKPFKMPFVSYRHEKKLFNKSSYA